MKSEVVSLSTNELAAVAALCGYETMASQILNSLGLEEKSVALDRFIEDTELSLTNKALKDVTRDTMIVEGLEELIHSLVRAKRKVRCIRKDKVLFMHFIDGEDKLLFQEIRNDTHVFYLQSNAKGFQSVLVKHFELNGNLNIKEIPTLQLSEEIYNQLHHMDSDILNSMIKDEKLAKTLRGFLADFKFNLQEFDNLSLIEMDYLEDYFEIRQVIFLLPGKDLVWHLDYERINHKEVFVVPYDSGAYSKKLSEEISLFFEDK